MNLIAKMMKGPLALLALRLTQAALKASQKRNEALARMNDTYRKSNAELLASNDSIRRRLVDQDAVVREHDEIIDRVRKALGADPGVSTEDAAKRFGDVAWSRGYASGRLTAQSIAKERRGATAYNPILAILREANDGHEIAHHEKRMIAALDEMIAARDGGAAVTCTSSYESLALYIVRFMRSRNRAELASAFEAMTEDSKIGMVDELAWILTHGGHPPNWEPESEPFGTVDLGPIPITDRPICVETPTDIAARLVMLVGRSTAIGLVSVAPCAVEASKRAEVGGPDDFGGSDYE